MSDIAVRFRRLDGSDFCRLARRLVGAFGSSLDLIGAGKIASRCIVRFAAHGIVVAARGAAAMSARTAINLVIGIALCALFLVDQCLPVGDRDLIVVGMDFAERQEAVAIAAVVDKRGL